MLAPPQQKKSPPRGPIPRRAPVPGRMADAVHHLSGVSIDGSSVTYNSPLPGALGVEAFAQGNDIHLGPGKEHHLGHEAWHVAQQRQGSVERTNLLGAIPINRSSALEADAAHMGAAATRLQSSSRSVATSLPPVGSAPAGVVQGNGWSNHFWNFMAWLTPGSRPGTNERHQQTSRSSFRKSTQHEAWDSAAPGPTSGKLCPTCKKEVSVPPGGKRKGIWDVNHIIPWTKRWFTPWTTRQSVVNDYQKDVELECSHCNQSGGNRRNTGCSIQ